MNNGTEILAKMLKVRENPSVYSPVFGTIIDLVNLKIRRSDKIILTKENVKSLIDLYGRDNDGDYIYLGKEAAMLPYDGGNKYLILGVVQNG